MSSSNTDTLMPKVLTDFIFDLYDSVTLSQIPDEQAKLYETDLPALSQKYFASQPWPSPQSIASECNGDPLFLAVYRELTLRHWHAVTRPTVRDRIEGWQVYRELFEEILDSSNFYLLPSWTFDILNEFVYQFQGFCQVRSAVFASARKHGLIHPDDGTRTVEAATTTHTSLLDNWNTLENSSDAWDVEAVFGYLHRLAAIGWCRKPAGDTTTPPPPAVYTYLSIFGAVAQSRLECLLGDYTACLEALTPLSVHGSHVIPKDLEESPDGATTTTSKRATVREVLTSVFGARTSVAYHAGVSLLMLRRYKDAAQALGSICAVLQRGFKTGQLRALPSSDQFMKQYDRMISLLALLTYICPAVTIEDSVWRVIREKHASRLETAASYEEWFQSPKFISVDPAVSMYRHQVQCFSRDMVAVKPHRTLRSYLKLYTALNVDKLAHFHDVSTADFIPSLLSYKLRMKQLTTTENDSGDSDNYMEHPTFKTALDIHYYVENDTVYVDEAERPRRFENYFLAQIKQGLEIQKDAVSIDTKL